MMALRETRLVCNGFHSVCVSTASDAEVPNDD
jgi:hypothetical protein